MINYYKKTYSHIKNGLNLKKKEKKGEEVIMKNGKMTY